MTLVRWVAPGVAALLAVAAAGTGAARGAELRGAPVFVVTPRDGATVGEGFLLAWDAGGHDGSFAVVVDKTVPPAGETVEADASTVVTTETTLKLTLSPREGGSPSARDWHRLVLVPLDSAGRRVGERVAVVHVRGTR